jgi:hypothetical protein
METLLIIGYLFVAFIAGSTTTTIAMIALFYVRGASKPTPPAPLVLNAADKPSLDAHRRASIRLASSK